MNEYVVQMMTLLSNVVRTSPVGTNLGLLHLLWMMVCGYLLLSRGAIIPGLHQMGLSDKAVRRGWQALRRGGWSIGQLLVNWEATQYPIPNTPSTPSGDRNETKRAARIPGRLYFWPSHELLSSYTAIPAPQER